MAIEEDPPAGVPEWVVSFGDMMSLLLTFFIMLVSMSEMKKDDKFQAVVDSLREQFGDSMAAVMIQSGELRPPNGRVIKMTKTAKHQREQMMRGSKVSGPRGDFDRVEVIRAGKRSGVGVVIYFEELRPDLSEDAKEQLRQLNTEIAGKPQKIEIRGHASRRPLDANQKFADHWEIAYHRALATMRFMVQDLAVDPQRIRICSAGANEPVAAGADPNERPQNARVEVMLLEEVVADLRVEDKDASAAEQERIDSTAQLLSFGSMDKAASVKTPAADAEKKTP